MLIGRFPESRKVERSMRKEGSKKLLSSRFPFLPFPPFLFEFDLPELSFARSTLSTKDIRREVSLRSSH